jgi:hypothetical protein
MSAYAQLRPAFTAGGKSDAEIATPESRIISLKIKVTNYQLINVLINII